MSVAPDATPCLRAYASRRSAALARQDAAEAQRRTLATLLRRAGATRFGRAHRFEMLRAPEEFRRAVPLRRYEDVWREFWQPAFPVLDGIGWPGRTRFLAVSSGTSAGRTKYLPVTPAMLRSNRAAALDVLVHHLAARPRSAVFGGRSFMLGGSTDLKDEGGGVRSGDLSGIASATIPAFARPYAFPPRRVALLGDWDRKLDQAARGALSGDIRALTGTPSWLLLLFERFAALRPDLPRRLASYLPRLALLVHGGVSFAPYAGAFSEWLDGGDAELREVYPASEGFFAIADRNPGEGLRLRLDGGIFFEFVPLEDLDSPEPRRHWVADAEPGVDYALVVSTCAGLWAYRVGDTVRLVSRDPPRVLVTGRTSYMLSAYGEHVTGEEIERALLSAAARLGVRATEFASAAEPADGGRGRHVHVIELTGDPPPDAAAAIAAGIDAALQAANDDYRAHRAGGQMTAPRVVTARPGTFAAWMRARGKLGGQNKVPRVLGDPDLLASLLETAAG